tara:strand:- start:242 stop:460 length:219 start_codon:yes stop_codon:yes gene_type:complete
MAKKKKTGQQTEPPKNEEAQVGVRVLKSFGGSNGSFSKDDVVTLPASVAEDYINCGYCEKASKQKVETATQK